ncbi:MAG: PIN domain-containing protein [Beutenbergiaceae bacterium]
MTNPGLLAVDTSIAVPFLVETHARHAHVVAAVGGRAMHLCGHALAETYSVLTRLPGDLAVDSTMAARLIDVTFASPLLLETSTAKGVHREFARTRVAGAATYDGLVALAARAHGAVLLSRDARARSTYEALGVVVELLHDSP